MSVVSPGLKIDAMICNGDFSWKLTGTSSSSSETQDTAPGAAENFSWKLTGISPSTSKAQNTVRKSLHSTDFFRFSALRFRMHLTGLLHNTAGAFAPLISPPCKVLSCYSYRLHSAAAKICPLMQCIAWSACSWGPLLKRSTNLPQTLETWWSFWPIIFVALSFVSNKFILGSFGTGSGNHFFRSLIWPY